MLFLMLAAVLFALLVGALAFVTGPVGLTMAGAIALWLVLYGGRSLWRRSRRGGRGGGGGRGTRQQPLVGGGEGSAVGRSSAGQSAAGRSSAARPSRARSVAAAHAVSTHGTEAIHHG